MHYPAGFTPNSNIPQTQSDRLEKPFSVELWDSDNPRSVVNLVPEAVKAAMLRASEEMPQLFGLDDRTLWYAIKKIEGKGPSPTDNRLRLAFWNEYNRAQTLGSRMEVTNIHAGVVARQYFYDRWLKYPVRVAWLLCPPSSYLIVMEEALQFGIEQLRDVLEKDISLPSGKIDHKLIELKLKIVALMDMRVKGAVTQRVEHKNLNLNLHALSDPQAVTHAGMIGTMDGIQKRLKELEKKDRLSAPKTKEEVIDV